MSPEPMFLTSAPHCTIGASRHHQPHSVGVGGNSQAGLKSPNSGQGTSPSRLSCRVFPCLQNPACPWEAHPSCPALRARDYSLNLSGAAGATMQSRSPAPRTKVPVRPAGCLWPAPPRAQACSSVAVLNCGRKTWRGLH